MPNSPTMLTVLALGLALLSAAGPATAQNCSCPPGYCCSQFGYCGTSFDYCNGNTCQSGPCTGSGGSSGANVSGVVTDAFFNGIKSQAGSGCEGSNFYSRRAFLRAASSSYPAFAHGGTEADGKREIAAFFAHVTHETRHLCYISEINENSAYCNSSNAQWPCAPGKKYYGRGPLQISWNYNYGPAGREIGFDGLGNPDMVAQDPVIAFKTALWFWMNNVHGVMPQGFGATIRAIDGALECNGNNPAQMNARVGYYKQYCQQFGVDPGNSLTC
ncbi:hypothetical protein BDA96_06G146700 [Sorghum bicolor]|uniref:chitinase n=2 Tax=Sorghum bicolor TaxID=4558 RepID=A0A921UCC3_SORBI|nr:hypothetical protein SORBI_3006G132700 [Sorghum bicolor]KAG0526449.1 hypothetical protein BDA96_06G146700 [Sorghum bicolor]